MKVISSSPYAPFNLKEWNSLVSKNEKFENLINKHLNLINNFNVEIDFDIEELKKEFLSSIDYMNELMFIDSENYFHNSIEEGRKIKQTLDKKGFDLFYKEYDIGHEISTDVIEDLSNWLEKN